MYTHLFNEVRLDEIRESHSRARRDAERSRNFRVASGRHRFRSRHRRT